MATGVIKNPGLDMTMQKGFILCHAEKSERSIVCNWCAREHYYSMGKLWAPIDIDLDDELAPKCDMCGAKLAEGPAIFGDFSQVQEEPMSKEREEPRGYVGNDLGVCHTCLDKNQSYKEVVGSWTVVMPKTELANPVNCLFCNKEI